MLAPGSRGVSLWSLGPVTMDHREAPHSSREAETARGQGLGKPLQGTSQ
jgi:hypothetical protein